MHFPHCIFDRIHPGLFVPVHTTRTVSGTYFFVASSQTPRDDLTVGIHLEAGRRELDYVELHSHDDCHEAGTVHAVVHLSHGERAYLRKGYSTYLWHSAAVFNGFLI